MCMAAVSSPQAEYLLFCTSLIFLKAKKIKKHKRPAIPWPWLKPKRRIFQGGFPSSHSLAYSIF